MPLQGMYSLTIKKCLWNNKTVKDKKGKTHIYLIPISQFYNYNLLRKICNQLYNFKQVQRYLYFISQKIDTLYLTL